MSQTPRESVVQATRERAVTEQVVQSLAGSGDTRFHELMSSLVRHLHAFARDVRLTEQEWEAAVAYLTRTGQTCSESRQEFILLSDVLGLSMLTVGINSPSRDSATESTVFGPFFLKGSPEIAIGGDIANGAKGRSCRVHGRVTDVDGTPVPGALIEVWEADADGFYDVQYDGAELRGRAHLFSDEHGTYDFWCVEPAPYPIPYDGPVGEFLIAAGRSPMRPAHVHFMVTARGFHPLITHIFVAGSPHLTSDAVFGVKPSLIVDFQEREAGPGPGGTFLNQPWVEANFDIRLAHDLDDPEGHPDSPPN